MIRPCATCGAEPGVAAVCSACGRDPNQSRVLDDKFRVGERLGRGGMSSVYRGVHLILGEPVAIKFLRPELVADPVLRERFRREALALARLRHPGIVSILDYGDADGEPYAVMELVEGVPFDELTGEGAGLPLLRAGPIFDQVLAALEACHAAGVVHRDVKPANVLVSTHAGAEYAKLIDFGLAHTNGIGAEKLTATGVIHGTPAYMAPEQCRGEEVGSAADVYAFAVTMYEVLSGKGPYEASDAATYMVQHLFVEPPPLRERVPALSAGIEDLVRRAMAKDPSRRPSSRELRHDLSAALRGTDAHSIAEAGAAERRRQGALARDERAITGRVSRDCAVGSPVTGSVLAWMPRGERTSSLLGALGAAGLPSSAWARADAPSPSEDMVVVVSAREAGRERLVSVRAVDREVPVVVVDVSGIDETSAMIRAGASDLALAGAPDAALAEKVKRLLRRRTRARGGRT